MGFAGSLEDEWAFDVVIVVFAVVLNLVLPIFSKVIDPDAIRFRVDNGKKFAPEFDETRGIYFALEDGILDALAVVEAGFGDVTQALLSKFCDGRNVVG